MSDKLVALNSVLNSLKQQSKQVSDGLNSFKHPDTGVTIFISKLKKLSLQSIDVVNEMQRQIGFLAHEIKNCESREKNKQYQDDQRKKMQERKQRRNSNELYS